MHLCDSNRGKDNDWCPKARVKSWLCNHFCQRLDYFHHANELLLTNESFHLPVDTYVDVFVMPCSLAASCAGMPRGHTVAECSFLCLLQKDGKLLICCETFRAYFSPPIFQPVVCTPLHKNSMLNVGTLSIIWNNIPFMCGSSAWICNAD